jgi:hypothetical protein
MVGVSLEWLPWPNPPSSPATSLSVCERGQKEKGKLRQWETWKQDDVAESIAVRRALNPWSRHFPRQMGDGEDTDTEGGRDTLND